MACRHVALLTPEALLGGGLSPAAKGAVPRLREEGAGGGFGEVAGAGRRKLGFASVERTVVLSCFLVGRCEGTLDSAPFRRLAARVSFGNTGTRDFATPNSPHNSARAYLRLCLPLQAHPEEMPHPRQQVEGGPSRRASALRPGSAIRRMQARVVDRGSIRRRQLPIDRGRQSNRRLPTPRR